MQNKQPIHVFLRSNLLLLLNATAMNDADREKITVYINPEPSYGKRSS